MHLRVALATLVFGRTRRSNQSGIHQRARVEQQALLLQPSEDQLKHLWRELVPLKQAPAAQDGGFVRQARNISQASKLKVQRAIVQLFFHGQFAQVPPQLHAMNAMHCVDGEQIAPAKCLVRAARVELDQRHQRSTLHQSDHLFKEDLLVGHLVQRIQDERCLIHARHLAVHSRRSLPGVARILQSFLWRESYWARYCLTIKQVQQKSSKALMHKLKNCTLLNSISGPSQLLLKQVIQKYLH